MSQYTPELKKLLEDGAKSYASKQFEAAVEHYGEACQLFSQGHDGDEDPELLHLYGKALFQVAQSKNGIFGGSTDESGTTEREDTEAKEKGNGMFTFSEDVPLAEEEDASEGEKNHDEEEEEDQEEESGNDDENPQEGSKQEELQGEEQSDFEVAWEILDLSRTLFESNITTTTGDSEKLHQIKLNLSDVYDLLGEISLETENFAQASVDFESLLKLRESVYPFESNMISEAHYKLSLALEFNFADEKSRTRAIEHLKKAIASIKQKQSKSGENKEDDVIKDLEIRLEDLQKDPNELFDQQKQDILKGILGQATAPSSSTLPAASAAPQKVNDLTSVVKKRKAKPSNDSSKKAKK